MSEWISVEDRLPDIKMGFLSCLIAKNNGVVMEAWFNGKTKEFQKGFNLSDEFNLKVTHWMPLPEAPVRKVEGGE